MTAKPSYEELERRVQELEIIESDYKHLMEVSQENDSLFKRLYEKAPLGYQSLDENGHFLVVNPTWLDTLGYTKDEVIGKSFSDFLHPDWRNHFKENFPRFKSVGEVLGVEFEMVKKNGDLILVSFTGKISRDKKGNFQQTHCIFHDITERKQTESALKLVAESSLLSAQNIFPFLVRQIAVSQGMRYALIARVDPSDSTAHTLTVWCGDRYEENFSYGLEGTPCNNVVSAGVCFYPSNVQSLFPQDQLLVEMGIESYWGTALRTSTGELLGVMAIMHDHPIIETPQTHALLQAFALRTSVEMERQQTEKLLRENQEDLKEAQHVAKLGNWRLNIKNNQVVWSDELYKMYGFDPTLPPPPYTEHMKLFTPESWESLSTALQHTRDTGIPYDLELKTLRLDGSHGWMWAYGMAEVDAMNEIIGLRGVAQDITDRSRRRMCFKPANDVPLRSGWHCHSLLFIRSLPKVIPPAPSKLLPKASPNP